MKSDYTIHSIEQVLKLLKLDTNFKNEFTLIEMVEVLKLNKSTIF